MNYYYPLLRNSNNEMKALRELKEDSRTKVIPIIESKRVKRENIANWQSTFKTLGRYLQARVKDMTFIYDFNTALEELGEDIKLETNDGENLVQHCLNKMNVENLNVIPCFQHDSPEWLISSVLRCNYPEIAIRVRCHDFQDSFNPFVYAKLKQDLDLFNVEAKITVILDFFSLPTTQNRIQNAISTFSKINNSKVVYLATSCPENASDANVHSITLIGPRTEYNYYLTLLHYNQGLLFGDYTTRLKGEVLSGFNHNNSYLKIFYSTETDYWIAKSKLIKDGGEYTFNEVCRNLIDYDFYPGEDFSYGDSQIKKCADNELSISDHQAPIAIGVNHHIETTVAQLNLISNSVSV
jgi:Beta protein